jgi:hypothetical protein
MGVKFRQKMSKMAFEKNRRFEIFRGRFWPILSKTGPIGIYRKTGPTKSTVLGPGPPPWEIYKIYRKNVFFMVLGAFNRAGKSVTKIGIYSKPPPKWSFYTVFIENLSLLMAQAIYRDPLQKCWLFYFGPWHVTFTLPFIGIQSKWLLWVFLVVRLLCRVFCLLWILLCLGSTQYLLLWNRRPPKKGHLRRNRRQ